MKLLIIEDDLNKSKQLAAFISQERPDIILLERRSYQSGLREIIASQPDLVVLDMTLPTYDVDEDQRGGRIRTYGGRDLLAEIARLGIGTQVIVVTQFETFGEGHERLTLRELSVELKRDYPDIYRGTIYYHPAQTDWRSRLAGHLRGDKMTKM